ncbi:2'-5' RNA ligase family protein [Cognatishimia sp. MH4019]|uniref:2'-5' RNA ligase family protein n=1 Tax=Cognatishimia sp. MH4019 TaxID=2854030 RepID=UPI001CD27413|nr:2'-5' RNA ligase family protein [Cognatishimia sp. MH4019]
MIYVLGYPVFEPSCGRRIAKFRAKHERRRAELVPAHITLVFGVPEQHLETIAELVDKSSSRFQEFKVSFNKYVVEFDPFEEKHKIFLLCRTGSDKARALHEQLYDGSHRSALSSEHPFRPHMTVATYETRADIERVDVSHVGEFPIEGILGALEVVQLKDGKLTTLKSVPFLG